MKNILTNDEISPSELLIKKLLAEVEQSFATSAHYGLCSGSSGKMLFLLAGESAYSGLIGIDKIQSHLAFIQSNYQFQTEPVRLDYGSVGVAWVQEFIQQNYVDENEDINEDVDNYLLAHLDTEKWQGEFELLAGLAGIGMYAARRYKFASGKCLANKVIEHFKNLAFETPEGLTWQTTPESAYHSHNHDGMEYNLGLAHGIPSVTAILVKLYSLSADPAIKEMLTSNCNWLISQKNPSGSESYFSYRAGQTSISRIGWCYGDISNALVLWRAGKLLDSPCIMQVAREIALQAASRQDLKKAQTFDAGLCHGTAGNMLIFQTLYDEMGDKTLLDCARFWLNETLRMFDEGEGLSGLYRWSPLDESYIEDFGLLEGYSGIGLCLMAAMGHDTQWKEHLLLG